MNKNTIFNLTRNAVIIFFLAFCTISAGMSPSGRFIGGNYSSSSKNIDNTYELIKEDETIHAKTLEEIANQLRFIELEEPNNPKIKSWVNWHEISDKIVKYESSIKDFEEFLNKSFSEDATEYKPFQQGQNEQIKNEILDQFNQFEILFNNLITSHNANNLINQKSDLIALAQFMQGKTTSRSFIPIKTPNPESKTKDSSLREIITDKHQLQEWINSKKSVNQKLKSPVSGDLEPTIEIQITPRIHDRALSLNNNPIEIYNWVRNNINYLPTYGSMQGSDLSLMNLQANSFDTSSLLIALLRDANIPARYAHGVIEVPIEKLKNWLKVDSAENALSLVSQGGIPAGVIIQGGKIHAVQLEHVWVEAWVDFIPSRGVKNIQGDTWIALDASFKQHNFIPAIDLSTYGTFDMNSVLTELDQGATHGVFGSITNVDTEHFRQNMNSYISQVMPALNVDHPNAKFEEMTNRYNVIAENRTTLPASLNNKIITLAQTYSAMPLGLMHHMQVKMYASTFNLSLNSPSLDYTIPLPELGLSTLSINYEAASPTDQQTLDELLNTNASSLRPYLINVKPQIQINGVTQIESAAKKMGDIEYWTTAIIDPNNLNSAPSQPFQWATGSQVVLAVDAAGITPDALTTHNEAIVDLGTGHIRNALHQAGLNYFVGHDLLDQLYAQQVNAVAVRMPSIGAFYAPLNVRYFFGIPRTASMSGYTTDIKRITLALVAPDDTKRQSFAMQSGSTGSALEAMVWEMLFDKPLGSTTVSAISILHHANTKGIPIHTITQSNLTDVMPLLQLSADTEQEIFNAVQAGFEVTVPEREFNIGANYQGIGYIIRNPFSGAALYRLEGGTNGAALLGCIAKAILLEVVFNKILNKIWKKIAIVVAITFGAAAIFGPAGILLGTVVAFASNLYFLIAFGAAVLQFADMLATRSIKDILDEYGIAAVISAACSFLTPCGGGLGGLGSPPCKGGACNFNSMSPNPVDILTGAKHQYQTDYQSSTVFGLQLTRLYYTATQFNSPTGIQWRHTYDRTVVQGDSLNHPWPSNLLLVKEDGGWYQFNRGGEENNEYFSRSDITITLVALGSDNTAPTGYKVINDNDETEIYNSEGRLISITSRSGLTQTLNYVNDKLATVTDQFGHSLAFEYDQTTGQLTKMTDPANQQYLYHHDSKGNLTQVDYPDSTSIKYHYEDNTLPNVLTGITNEKNIRFATYVYNIDGKVIDTYTADNQNHYHFNYGDLQTVVTDPLGKQRTYNFAEINQQMRLTSIDEVCSSCGSGGNNEQHWDGRGWLREQIDFEGNKTTFGYNDRGLETRHTQAKNTNEERTTTTTWHNQYTLPATITEPSASSGNKLTTYSYFPNGETKTKTITADGQDRVWTYTYNAFGQMLTEDGPRTDVNDITTWTYDASGNKRTMTNALGHLTKWDNYNAHGQARSMTDANDIVTTYTYDDLTRLTHSNKDGEITQYDYTPTGNLDKLILPDASFLKYGYDNTDWFSSIEDNLGNKIIYTLDNAGNRTIEKTYNDSAVLQQTLTNVYNDLGQLQNTIGADNQTTTWSYDGNGNEKTQSYPLLHLTQSDYDALNRLTQITDPDLNTIKYDYDKQDNLTKVTDPRNLDTVYTYNGFNEQTKLTSPDTGITDFVYDQAGNLSNKTDARGQQADYIYDELNRVKTITYSDETITFDYDTGTNAIGRLSSATDNSGQTTYTYDADGRVDIKTQTTNSINLSNDYDYNALGQLEKLTTPSGVQITYSYRADGRVTTISVNGIEITRNIEYFSFGEPSSWNYGNNFDYQRTFDNDGRVETYTQGNDIQTLAYDDASRITALTDTSNAWGFTYDNLDRLATADDSSTSAISLIWDYDPTGNRLFETLNGTQTDYTTEPASNKLAQLGSTSRTYDAVGNLEDNGTITSTYSGRNRLISTQGTLAPTLYEYNAFGERVGKQSAAQILFAYDEDGHLVGEYQANGDLIQETIWLDDTPIATIRPNTESHNGLLAGDVKIFFIQPDHLDSPRTIVDNSNQPIWQWHSDPFGKELANNDVDGDSSDFVFNYRFPGQYFDSETNTHYNYFRDYEPETGRYLQSDPIGLEDGSNTYVYTYNSPVNYFDIDGLSRKTNKGNTIILLCQLWANMEDMRNPDFDVKGDRGGNKTTTSQMTGKLPKPKPKKPKYKFYKKKKKCTSCNRKKMQNHSKWKNRGK